MKKNLKRFFSMVLALSMVFSLVVPAAATETHAHDHAEEAKQEETINMESVLENITVNAEDVKLELDFNNYVVLSDPDFEADMSDPAIITLETELRNITVLDEGTGESIALTEEQVQTILYLYSQYMDNWAANADVLGIQTPFFLSYNDKKDELGVLGEMLVLAGVSVDKVRTGEYTFQELQGTVELFLYADILGVQYYGQAVEAARDEVMQLIKNSGAQTEAQKLLIINDWLAHNNTFDMPYIMNADKDLDGDGKVSDAEKADERNKDAMVAPNPVDHEHKQDIYDFIYANYEKNLNETFRNNIRTGLEAEFKKQYYEGAIKNIIYEGALAEMRVNEDIVNSAKQAVGWDAVYEEKLEEEEKKVYDEAYNEYLKNNHKHEVTVTFNWVEGKAEDGTTIWTCETATAECADETCEAVLTADVELKSEVTPAKCEEAGKTVYTATATVTTTDAEGAAVTVGDPVEETKEVVIEALGHDFVDGKCSRCEKTEVCEHQWNDGEVTTAATCGDDGVKTFTCTKCNETQTEVIPATGAHVDNRADDVCDVCGKDIIPVTTECEHEYDEGAVTTAATCEAEGVMTYTCTKCKHSYTETISATGHAYDEGKVTREATCVTAGVKTYTCANCNGTKTEDIPVTDHTYDDGVVTTEASCETAGVKTYTCSVCDGTKTEEIAATGHDYKTEVSVQPTCGAKGQGTDTCANCGDVKTVEIPATGEHVDDMKDSVCDKCGQDIPSSGSAIPEAVSLDAVTVAEDGDDTTGDDTTEEIDPDADAYAKKAVEDKKEEIEAAAKAAADEETKLNEVIETIVTGTEEDEEPTECEKQAEAAAEQFMTENAEAIAADPVAFVDGMLAEQPEVAAQIHAGWDAFWADAQENGVAMDPSKPDEKMTVDQIVEWQMDQPQKDDMLMKRDQNGNPILDEEGNHTYMTPNEAIPVYSDVAAAQMTPGVINYWEGSHFGAFGMGTSVCLGYTKAFTYLVQCLHPEIYLKDGATDTSKPENWKTAQDLYYDADGNLDINQNYVVDAVRVTFDASVTMYGETEDNFNSDHFWNAVKIDGKWYYADPCYTDVFTEVMMRDRVETDGQMNHLYFIFSHTAAVNMYDGNYKEIKSLYENVATHTDYEDSWISRIKSNTYFADGYAYYMYDSTDMLTMMEEYKNQNTEADIEDPVYKIVRHKLTGSDAGTDGDEDYETLIVFNYKANDDAEAVARVYDPEAGETVDNELLTELWHKHAAYAEVYPSIAINAAYYNGKIYFNLANCLLSYDVASGELAMVKEYNTVHGQRDTTKAFGGMAFSVVSDGGDFTVENHPIAGMTIKDDGNMYVSVATNFAFISGKADRCDPASDGYGYEYEESNFNDDYNSYMDFGDYDDDELASYGYTKETNDNDEFMWTANFVEKMAMSHLAGNGHEYAAVSVDAACGVDAYTENRCTNCGAIEADSRVYEEGTAIEHHFVKWDETYYTKDDAGSWNKGHCYVCTECGYAINDPGDAPADSAAQEIKDAYAENKAAYDAAKEIAGHTYVPTDATWAEDNSSVTFSVLECSAICPERKPYLDCLLNDNTISITLAESVTFDVTEIETMGTCPEGVTKIYKVVAEVEVDGVKYPFIASKTVELEPTDCTYEDGVCIVCGDCAVKRIYGQDRISTALSVAEALKDALKVEKFDSIILAAGGSGSDQTKFADALSGSYLATTKGAPILLYTKGDLSPKNLEFIQENLSDNGTIYLLGGNVSIPAEVEEALKAEGYTTQRLGGVDRYDTNLIILEAAGIDDAKEILIASGRAFADSLSASATGLPMLLVNGNKTELTDAQVEFLQGVKDKKITILGGTAAVTAELEAAIEEAAGTDAARIFGDARENTSAKLAEKYFADADTALIAYSKMYPDGLAGGVLANALHAPLLLTKANSESIANAYIEECEIEVGYVLGGTAVLTDETAKAVFGLSEAAVINTAYYTE